MRSWTALRVAYQRAYLKVPSSKEDQLGLGPSEGLRPGPGEGLSFIYLSTLVTRDAFLKIFAKRCVCRRDLEGKLMVLTIALRPIFGVLLLIKIFPVALQLLIFWQGHDAHLRRAVGIT